MFSKTLYLSARDTDRFTIPSLESRITSDTYNVQNFVAMIQRMGIRAPILLLGGVWITLFMDSALALVMIAIVGPTGAGKIDGYIESLPGGYDTLLSDDGVNISKGQRQLITIARAFLSDAPC